MKMGANQEITKVGKSTKLQIFIGMISVLMLVALDQFVKNLVVLSLKGKESIVIIKGVFEFEYLENRGAAFSILQGQRSIFIILTIFVVAFIAWEFIRIPQDKKYLFLRITFILVLSGAIGNVIDRIVNQYVVDFIYFSLINFPHFNLADSYMTIAVALLIILTLFYYKEDELDFLFHFKSKK